jgi:hypothetical protein
MTMSLTRKLLLTLALGLMSPVALACNIIYGKDWAFVSQAPEGWNAYCGEDAPPGTNLVMLPQGKTWEDTDAVLYVSVFDRTQPDLAAFVRDEQKSFLAESPSAKIAPLELRGKKRPGMIFNRIDGARGGKYELAAYAEGPHAYYLIVLSNDSAALRERNRAAFIEYLDGFHAMKRSR